MIGGNARRRRRVQRRRREDGNFSTAISSRSVTCNKTRRARATGGYEAGQQFSTNCFPVSENPRIIRGFYALNASLARRSFSEGDKRFKPGEVNFFCVTLVPEPYAVLGEHRKAGRTV